MVIMTEPYASHDASEIELMLAIIAYPALEGEWCERASI
jgi:hypothetical protein